MNEIIYPHTRRAILATSSNFLCMSSQVIKFPDAAEAKPHWVLRARFSTVHILLRLLDAAHQFVFGFEFRLLGRDQAQHDGLALGHETQRLETAGAVAVELQ